MFAYGEVFAMLFALSMGMVSIGFAEEVHYEPDWKLESWNDRLPGFKARLTPQGFKFGENRIANWIWANYLS